MPSLPRMTLDDVHERRWELLALTSIGAFMSPLDTSILSVAYPTMSPALHLSFSAALWVQAAYLVVMAVLLIPLGRMADHYGRVRFYLLGIAVFTVGSLLAALSMNAAWMIGSRATQGVGGALLSATSAAIVTAAFPPRERGRALGVNVMAVYLGLSLGPPLGGLLVEVLGWRWVFLVNLPVGVVSLVWGWLLLPRAQRSEHGETHPDVAGAISWAVCLLCLIVPLTFASHWGWESTRTIVSLLVSAAALVVFVWTESRARSPLLHLDLLRRNRLFAAANAAALLNYVAIGAIGVLTAIFLEVAQGRSAGVVGWLLLSQPALMAVLSPLSGRLSDSVGSRWLTSSGMAVIAIGMSALAMLEPESGMAHVIAALAIVGLGMAAFSAPNSSAVMGSVAREQLSLAGGFLGTMRVTGMALSFAVLGAVAASQLGHEGGRLIFSGESGTSSLAGGAIAAYALGYRYAMACGAVLAVVGAAVSLTRGPRVDDADTTRAGA
ncbi:MAG: MFS transporter [Thermoleophilia bacterium]